MKLVVRKMRARYNLSNKISWAAEMAGFRVWASIYLGDEESQKKSACIYLGDEKSQKKSNEIQTRNTCDYFWKRVGLTNL